MSTTHTPGPWMLQTSDSDIFVEVIDSPTEGVTLATLPADEVGYANARLIAAAPELLAALNTFLLASDLKDDSQWEARRLARAAIAKAEGTT